MIEVEPKGATPLDPDEMEGLLLPHITTRGELNEAEDLNIEKCMEWLSKQKSPNIYTIDFVKQVHQQMLGEVWGWAGQFRWTGKSIGIEPAFIYPQLQQLLGDVKYWIENQTYSPRECAARFHHKLVYIHLFPNGNGRHSRIMANYLLALLGEPQIDWSGGENIDEVSSAKRDEYIATLRAADRHDFQPLLNYVNA